MTQGGGGTLIFSYIRGLGSFWGVQNFEFQYFFFFFFFFGGGVLKNKYLGGGGGGYEDFVDIFRGVITKLDYIEGSFLYINFRVFS